VVSSQARRFEWPRSRASATCSRRACELLDIACSGLGYQSVRAERDRPALEAMKRLAG
jgi:hypothetical protein